MESRYEQLLERSVKAQEEQSHVSTSLLEVARGLKDNVKELNDKFVLHSRATDDAHKELCENLKLVKDTLIKWIKWLGVALLVAVGGASLFKVLSGIDFSNFIK